MNIKSEGFDIRLVLPASTNMSKVSKKILGALPKGTSLLIGVADHSLQSKPVFVNSNINNVSSTSNSE